MDDGTFASYFYSSFSPSSTLLPLLATSTILLASGIYWLSLRKEKSRTAVKTVHSTTGPSNKGTSSSFNASTRLKNVWDTPTSGQPTSSSPSSSSLSSSKERVGDRSKPFGSSYYYAHNNPNAKGGYKDGLKMEDYTMNGPRLLSKGGKPVKNIDNNADDDGRMDKENDQPDTTCSTITLSPPPPSNDDEDKMRRTNSTTTSIPIRSITKYTWDDPGDSNGIATIRIDSLPSLASANGTMLEWKSVTVDQVKAELVGEGMVVRVHAQSPLALYELKIPKLYGEAAFIQAINKPKRLLIKITKKKQQSSILFSSKHANSNLDVWPQPHRKL